MLGSQTTCAAAKREQSDKERSGPVLLHRRRQQRRRRCCCCCCSCFLRCPPSSTCPALVERGPSGQRYGRARELRARAAQSARWPRRHAPERSRWGPRSSRLLETRSGGWPAAADSLEPPSSSRTSWRRGETVETGVEVASRRVQLRDTMVQYGLCGHVTPLALHHPATTQDDDRVSSSSDALRACKRVSARQGVDRPRPKRQSRSLCSSRENPVLTYGIAGHQVGAAASSTTAVRSVTEGLGDKVRACLPTRSLALSRAGS